MIAKKQHEKTLRLVMLATFTALVILLQLAGSFITIGTLASVSLVLVPIVLGAIMLGPAAGAWLGFVFGAVVIIVNGMMAMETIPFTSILFQAHPVLTTLLCLVKGTAAGYAAGCAYLLLKKVNEYVALFAAAAIAPTVNTLIFILGSYTMMDTFRANFLGEMPMFYFLVIGCAGWNYIFELLLNLLLCPALSRVIAVIKPKEREA